MLLVSHNFEGAELTVAVSFDRGGAANAPPPPPASSANSDGNATTPDELALSESAFTTTLVDGVALSALQRVPLLVPGGAALRVRHAPQAPFAAALAYSSRDGNGAQCTMEHNTCDFYPLRSLDEYRGNKIN